MDILDIDATSYATRVAQVAAAELYGLMTTGEPSPVDHWFMPPDWEPDDGSYVADQLEAMAEYVMRTRCVGETLYRWRGGRHWADESYALRKAYERFCATLSQVGGDLLEEQLRIGNERRQAKPKPKAKVRRSDMIFEKHGTIGEKRKASVKAEAIRKARLEADRAKFNNADPAKFDHDGDGKPGGSKPKPAPKTARAKGKPLSVGEAPAKPPVNRGGRGRRKPAKG